MEFLALSIAFFAAGGLGLALALVLVKMGYGSRVVGAISKGSRLAIRAMTKRLRRRR